MDQQLETKVPKGPERHLGPPPLSCAYHDRPLVDAWKIALDGTRPALRNEGAKLDTQIVDLQGRARSAPSQTREMLPSPRTRQWPPSRSLRSNPMAARCRDPSSLAAVWIDGHGGKKTCGGRNPIVFER